jgi:hypothetical protein
MGKTEEPPEESDECQCIETFLNWHNKQLGTNLSYQRAENVYRDIAASTRWDFIITQSDSSKWHAAEIKRLIRPEAKIQLVRWNKFLMNIKNSLGNMLQGEFLIYGAPSLKLDKRKRTELQRLLAELIQRYSQSLRKDEMIDLGSYIIKQFPEWPSTPHLNMSLPPHIEYVVNTDSCFTLHKLSDIGCSLELGFAQSGACVLDQAVIEALTSLFDNGEIIKANTQLGLAKQKGAKGTILLLDFHLPSWYPNHVRRVLANNLNSENSSNTDVIYLVKTSQNRVSKVWGATRNSF